MYKLFFRCKPTAGGRAAIEGGETSEARFFAESELPALSAPRVTPEQLRRMFERAGSPGLPADFD